MRMKPPTARYRRANGFRPPLGIALSYAVQLRRWFDALQTELLAAAEHEHASRRLRTDADLHGLRVNLEARVTGLRAGLHTIATRVVKRNAADFRRVIGVPTNDLGLGHAVATFQARNVGLITTLANKQLDEVAALVKQADAEAWRVEDLTAAIADTFPDTNANAELIARDQVLKLNGQITAERQQRAGVTSYIWTTTGDERVRGRPKSEGGVNPRGLHYELEGTRQSWAAPPVMSEDGRRGHPGSDYQCRCVAYPLIDVLDE